jgi:hypothetical protein
MTDERDPRRRRGFAGFAIFLALVLGVPASACTSMGACHARELRQIGEVSVENIASIPTGAQLELVGTFVPVAREEGSSVGASLYVPAGTTRETAHVFVYAEKPISTAGPVKGQICDESILSPCQFPSSLDSYLREQRKRGVRDDKPVRVVTTDDSYVAAWFGVIITFAFAALLVGLFPFALMTKKKMPSISVEHAWTVQLPGERIAAAIEHLRGTDELRIAHAAPRRIVFYQGRPEYEARLRGFNTPDLVLRRVELVWEDAPYQPTRVTARIADAVEWMPKKRIEPLVRSALDRTASQLASALQCGSS